MMDAVLPLRLRPPLPRPREEDQHLHVATFRKHNWRPQYLMYYSEHPYSCKKAILACEARRHLVNCSQREDYELRMVELKAALRARGYPANLLIGFPYDETRRDVIIRGLEARELRSNLTKKQQVLTLKVEYFKGLCRLRINKEMEDLVEDLRTEAGSSFLADTRLVVATLVRRSSFVTMYRQHFLPSSRKGRIARSR